VRPYPAGMRVTAHVSSLLPVLDREDVGATSEPAGPSWEQHGSPPAGPRLPPVSAVGVALLTGGVRSVFQPIVDLGSARVVAFEALARGPAGPLEPPDALFAAARAVGLLAELDEACRSAAFAGASRLGPVAPHTVFVNVEPEVLDSAPLSELLTIADAPPGELRVVLEITERALAVRPAELLRTVERVRDLGWGVALDDVGADSASLALMALLRPGVVKLDLSLIQDRPSPAVAEIMHAVNAYAERSGALVLAEGIETDRHLAAARALGATSGQGCCSVTRPPTRTRPFPCTPSTCPSSTASRTGRRSARPSPACPPTWC
jgi:EAL domain-containing protein (putative c-di-GMP-specific phosphodiesterase class I)